MRVHHFTASLAAACALGLWAVAPAGAETIVMKADLKSATEVPAGTTTGTGSVSVSFDTATKTLTWTGTYAGLTGPATAAHFHGPAEPGKNAGVMVPSTAALPMQGSAVLTDAQAQALTGGMMYFNIHTAANPGGEIRGQVTR